MTSTSAYAPYLQTYGQTVPYLTADEYQRAPTAVDVANLVSGGNGAGGGNTGADDLDALCLGGQVEPPRPLALAEHLITLN